MGGKQPRGGVNPNRGGTLAQSMGGSVLGLHSCRALSPGPPSQPTTVAGNVEGRPDWKNGWPSVIQSVLESIEPINQKDQPCR